MAERKNIGKKMRFEVFKRDSFRCQYCGRYAPNVILEVDHIKPVVEGGKNTMMNLVTSCRDCNRGKGKRKLDDSAEITKQKSELDALNEKRLQMEMMLQWKTELEEVIDRQVTFIESNLVGSYNYVLNDRSRNRVKVLIKEFGFSLVHEASEIAERQYCFTQDRLEKLGGICYNLKRGKRDGY